MSDFKFNCPHCTQPLEAPEDMIGESIECPSCNGTIQLSDPQPPVQSRTTEPSRKERKDCPFCGEEILATARKCKHCGEFLDGSSRASAPSEKKPSGPENIKWTGNPSGLYYSGHWIIGILLLPLLGFGLAFILYAILDQRSRVYTVTTRKVMEKSGIVSRKTHEVTIRDIRSINMNQSVLERIFGLGSIQIGSAGTAGVEVEFKGIKNPARVRDEIRKIKDELAG